MALPRDAILSVVAGDVLGTLPLTPEDYFVVSRITGPVTAAVAISASGLDARDAERILSRLIEIGALRSSAPTSRASASAPAAPAQAPHELRDRAKARREQMLQAQLGAKTKPTGADQPPGGAPRAGVAAPVEPRPVPPAEIPPREPESVPADDPRIAVGLDIPVATQRRLLWLKDHLDVGTHFEILGIQPTMDPKAIRRGYHQTSRELHPDRFYRKQAGEFSALAAELFKRAKGSYELLMDDTQRSRYVERLLTEQRKRDAEHERAAADERERRQRAEDGERRRRELEEAVDAMKRAEAEQEKATARARRDTERRERSKARLSGVNLRNSKAQEHYDEGVAEREGGRHGAAASLFRLAMDLDPNNLEYHRAWQESLGKARHQRAESAFQAAQRLAEMGQDADAAHYFRDAADANPTARNLAEAAASTAGVDPHKARDLALSALGALRAAQNLGTKVSAEEAARVHLCCARAFLAAEQHSSARAQAELALQQAPNDPGARALLNSIKVP